MTILQRQAAAAALALTLVSQLTNERGPPVGTGHEGVFLVAAFVITEFAAGWHVLVKQFERLVRRHDFGLWRRISLH